MLTLETGRQDHLRPLAAAMVAMMLSASAPELSANPHGDIQGASVMPTRKADFVCDGGQRLSVTFDAKAAHLVDRSGRRAVLTQQPAASGIWYESAGESLRGKGQEVTWSRPGQAPLVCRSSAGGDGSSTPLPAPVAGLTDTRWQLVQFQSSDDAIGVIKPQDATRFTMELAADGRVAMRVDCNRANGPWTATATSATGGSLSLGPLAMTRAACPDRMGDRLAKDIPRVRSYTLKDDTLNLALEADSGVYTWRRLEK